MDSLDVLGDTFDLIEGGFELGLELLLVLEEVRLVESDAAAVVAADAEAAKVELSSLRPSAFTCSCR